MIYRDHVHTTTTISLSYWDRLRVLCGAPLVSKVRVRTEHEVGATEIAESRVLVGRGRSEAWLHAPEKNPASDKQGGDAAPSPSPAK